MIVEIGTSGPIEADALWTHPEPCPHCFACVAVAGEPPLSREVQERMQEARREHVAECRAATRAPRPPEELVGALQDRVTPASGRLIAAKPIVTTRGRYAG